MNETVISFSANTYQKNNHIRRFSMRESGYVFFYFSTITRRFVITVVAITAKPCSPPQVVLYCCGPCTAASCADLC